MDGIDLEQLLNDLDERVATEFGSMPDVTEVGHELDLDELDVEERRWARVDEVVAVVADLQDSTKLGTGKKARSTASIYEAAVGPLSTVLSDFGSGHIAVQGDAAVGVFWGERRLERALFAGITVKTFSQKSLEKRIKERWPEQPTGFKVGLAASRILIKHEASFDAS